MKKPRAPSIKIRLARGIEGLLILAGLTAVGVWAWHNVRYRLVQIRDNDTFERSATFTRKAKPAGAVAILNGGLVGLLVIPRLELHAIVREGTADDTLDVALGHIAGTAFPGQNGNVGVAGHRDTLFRHLGGVRTGDLILFDTPSSSYTYLVEGTEIVEAQDVAVLRPASHAELTLVTCFPFRYVGAAPDRFIVKARLLSHAGGGIGNSVGVVAD